MLFSARRLWIRGLEGGRIGAAVRLEGLLFRVPLSAPAGPLDRMPARCQSRCRRPRRTADADVFVVYSTSSEVGGPQPGAAEARSSYPNLRAPQAATRNRLFILHSSFFIFHLRLQGAGPSARLRGCPSAMSLSQASVRPLPADAEKEEKNARIVWNRPKKRISL